MPAGPDAGTDAAGEGHMQTAWSSVQLLAEDGWVLLARAPWLTLLLLAPLLLTIIVWRQSELIAEYPLGKSNVAPLERLIPRHGPTGILLALALAAATWALGHALSPDRKAFLLSPEWQVQPFYLIVHLVTLGSFVRIFASNFRVGLKNLATPAEPLADWVRKILGWRGLGLAIVVAAPFAVADFRYLVSGRYPTLGGGPPGNVDYLMWSIWSVEWLINAFVWVVVTGFLFKNCQVIRAYPFRDPIEIVVHERKYRPFLRMSAEGASVVLAFGAVMVLYIWYAGGELTDYFGLAITAILLVIGFLVPWLQLRQKVKNAVADERRSLEKAVASVARFEPGAALGPDRPVDLATLQYKLDSALVLLRLQHLEQLHVDLGANEARALLIRISAPVLTIVWQTFQHWGEVVAKFEQLLRSLATAIGVVLK